MAEKSLREKIIAEFPELDGTESFMDGTVRLLDRSDGEGAFIYAWNYSKPLPDSLASYLR